MSSNSGGPSPWGSPGGSSGGKWRRTAAAWWRRTLGRRGPGGPFGGRPGGAGPAARPRCGSSPACRPISAPSSAVGGPRGGFTGGRGLALIGLAVVALWLASGFYRVQPDELGVVLRFGAFNRVTQPGLQLALPWPIEHVLLPAVTRINRTEIGYRSARHRPALPAASRAAATCRTKA